MQTQSIASKLGPKIRLLRKAAGLTQAQLAEIVDVSVNFIGYVERSQQVPSLKMVERIAHGLKVPPKALFEFGSAEDNEYERLYETLSAGLRRCSAEDLRALIHIVKHLGNRSMMPN